MKAGLVTFQITPSKSYEAVTLWQELVSEMQKIRGFKGSYLLSNHSSGKCVGLGFWETQEDSEAFGSSKIYRDFTLRLQDLLSQPPIREQFDISTGCSDAMDLNSPLKNPSLQVAS